MEHCREALKIVPENVLVLHKLALAYVHLGRWKDARRCLARGLKVDPEHKGLRDIQRRFRAIQCRHWMCKMMLKG